ncbi:NAD-dependent malic enzyme, mitochondrial [Lambiella insularis]|nr:NAD-dependent malic enzyme, mitochondrial [Lambiella insularis]
MASAMPFLNRLLRPFTTSTHMSLNPESAAQNFPANAQKCTVAAGCFWGVEHLFRKNFDGKGLLDARVGYIGGDSKNPSYRAVCSGRTGHAESLQMTFDPAQLSYSTLLQFFYKMHDPTTKDRQGMDAGTQYRSAIFYHNEEQEKEAKEVTEKAQQQWWKSGKITTEILPAAEWWDAEAYHQLYLHNNPGGYECPAHYGTSLLATPAFNKGSAFTKEERKEFGLHGLLPPNVQTLDEQVRRAYDQYCSRQDALAKNTFMSSMKEQNEVLYYKLINDHLKEMFGIIYTPTEGDAIQNFSRLFRKPEGCFLNIVDIEQVYDNLSKFGSAEDIDYIVVTDGEEILGIGDQGVGGILISVAKSVITTLCAGVHPSRTLAVVLDCGTDNEDLLKDELYLGLRQRRVRGEQYDRFVDAFVQAARKLYPRAYIHFEDFGLQNAKRLLDLYRPHMACFNDDVQGTGCVTLAGVMAALKISKVKMADMRMVIFGSGSAGTGIADQVRDAIAAETEKSKEEAAKQIWCVDKPGLLLKSQGDHLTRAQVNYARNDDDWKDIDHSDLFAVVQQVKPHVLIGTSTKPKAFTEEIVKEMAKHVERPIIFPLSNPTRLHEADPKDINEWTKGKALIATGSPFPPVEYNGKKYEVGMRSSPSKQRSMWKSSRVLAECNNSTCFPSIALGTILSRSRLLSDKMLVAAVKALAEMSPALKDPDKGLLPDVVDVREISVKIAKAVIKQAVEEELATEKGIPGNDRDLEEWVREQMWEPRYRPLKLVKRESVS